MGIVPLVTVRIVASLIRTLPPVWSVGLRSSSSSVATSTNGGAAGFGLGLGAAFFGSRPWRRPLGSLGLRLLGLGRRLAVGSWATLAVSIGFSSVRLALVLSAARSSLSVGDLRSGSGRSASEAVDLRPPALVGLRRSAGRLRPSGSAGVSFLVGPSSSGWSSWLAFSTASPRAAGATAATAGPWPWPGRDPRA